MNRNYLLDNAKFIMIFFVVFGHFIELLINDNLIIKKLYLLIYSFHIPVFVIISGMLSKVELTKNQINKLIKSILIPYISFTLLYELLNILLTGEVSGYTRNLQPYWILWFLFSLFIWKFMLVFFLKFRVPILLSLILSIGEGYFDMINNFLGISRTLYFFPFFLIGYKLSPKVLIYLQIKHYLKWIFFLFIMFFNFEVFNFYPELQPWLSGSMSYSALNVHTWIGGLIRLFIYLLSFLSIIAVLLLIPKNKIGISSRGENSLIVYIWHGLFIKVFLALGILELIRTFSEIESLIILFCISVLITFLLSSDFVKNISNYFFINPLIKFFLNK